MKKSRARTGLLNRLSRFACILLCTFFCFFVFTACGQKKKAEAHTATTFAMDTLVTQKAYGKNAVQAMQEVNLALAQWEKTFSMFRPESDIALINAAAGRGGADVSPETAELLSKALAFSAKSKGAYAVTIAPLTLAWGVTGENPRVPGDDEIGTLLPLVNDSLVEISANHITLPKEGMGLDLGGIAKGAACAAAAEIYRKHGVESAYISIGGNVYAHGTKPDGTPFRIAFEDPYSEGDSAYIASFEMENAVIAVSGGHHRFFEENGQTYIHIIDPRTGKPAESDIAAVGVICEDGAEADFYSTTLFIWGKEKALEYMQNGGTAILLDKDGGLYVSKSLENGFEVHRENEYTLSFI